MLLSCNLHRMQITGFTRRHSLFPLPAPPPSPPSTPRRRVVLRSSLFRCESSCDFFPRPRTTRTRRGDEGNTSTQKCSRTRYRADIPRLPVARNEVFFLEATSSREFTPQPAVIKTNRATTSMIRGRQCWKTRFESFGVASMFCSMCSLSNSRYRRR